MDDRVGLFSPPCLEFWADLSLGQLCVEHGGHCTVAAAFCGRVAA